MDIYEHAKQYLEELRSLPTFLDRASQKGRYLRQGGFTFVGTR